MEKKTATELDWFDFETRMRDVIHELIEPVMRKATEDREQMLTIRRNQENDEKRLDQLESAVLKTGRKATVFDEIQQKFVDIEGDRKKQQVKVEQDLEEFRGEVKAINFKIEQKIDTIKHLDTITEQLGKDIEQMSNTLSQHKTVLLEEINKLGTEFTDANDTYKKFVQDTEEKATQSLNKVHSQGILLNKIEKDLETIKKEAQVQESNLRHLTHSKLEIQLYERNQEQISNDFFSVRNKFDDITNQLINRDSFIDRIYPLRVYTMISDAVYSCIDRKSAKSLAEFESKYLKELNELALITNKSLEEHDGQVEKIMGEIQHVEIRKMEILSERKKTIPRVSSVRQSSNTSEVKITSNQTATQEESPDSSFQISRQPSTHIEPPESSRQVSVKAEPTIAPQPPVVQQPQRMRRLTTMKKQTVVDVSSEDSESEDQVDNEVIKKITSDISKIRQDMLDTAEKIRGEMRGGDEELRVFVHTILGELEDVVSKGKKEKAEILLEVDMVAKRAQESEVTLSHLGLSIENMSEMMTCLVENSQIQQALEAQDEEDRFKLADNHEREFSNAISSAGVQSGASLPNIQQQVSQTQSRTAIPSGQFAMKKNCLSCKGSSATFLSGVKSTLTYMPTPLIYRKKKFTRAQLIALRGKMLQNCWEAVSAGPPWQTKPQEPVRSARSSITVRPPNPKNSALDEENQTNRSNDSGLFVVAPKLLIPKDIKT